MATVLFIKRSDIVKNSIIDGSVDTDKFIYFIKIAQEMHIQNYIGTKLYDKITNDISTGNLTGNYLNIVNEYIQPMLIHFAMVDYMPFASFELKNGGLVKHSAESSENATKEEVDFLVQKHRNFADFYTRRFIDYMSFNSNLFPEYNSNQNEDMYPEKDANWVGWVL
jgi:hypothetical protein